MKDLLEAWLRGEPGARLTANPELVLGNKPVAPVIDLQRRYDIQVTNCGRGIFQAIDRVSYDPDPEATLHCEGWGSCPNEAVSDLMTKIGEAVVELEMQRKPS